MLSSFAAVLPFKSLLPTFVWLSCWCQVCSLRGNFESECGNFRLRHVRSGEEVTLKPRHTRPRVIDTIHFCNAYEREELLLRLEEMGDVVDEVHILEGNRDFTGARKTAHLAALLREGDFQKWKDKITLHFADIPQGVTGYDLQDFQRAAMHEQLKIGENYKPWDVILEGDLDEIVSRETLSVLRRCEPLSGTWNTAITMINFYYSMAWESGDWGAPTNAIFFNELGDFGKLAEPNASSLATDGFARSGSKWLRPYRLERKDGQPTGWHVAWTLNGAPGLAHKISIHVEGKPQWLPSYVTKAGMEKFLRDEFLPDPSRFDTAIYQTHLCEAAVPQVLVRSPERFPNILRDVLFAEKC